MPTQSDKNMKRKEEEEKFLLFYGSVKDLKRGILKYKLINRNTKKELEPQHTKCWNVKMRLCNTGFLFYYTLHTRYDCRILFISIFILVGSYRI